MYHDSMADTRSTAEKQLDRIEQRVAKRGSGFKFTPEAIEKLNRLEAQLRVKATSNKNLQIGFGQVTSFLQELANMTPEQQAAKRAEIRQQAEDTYAGYFERKRSRVSEDFDTYIDRLNRDFNFATEDEISALKTKIAGLDRDTAEAIGASFRNVIQRGLGNSGALRQIANQIVSQRRIAADQVNQITDLALRNLRTAKADRSQDATRALERGEQDIQNEEAITVRNEESNILDRIIQQDLLLQAGAGANTLAPRVVEPEAPTIDASDPISLRISNLTSAPAPAAAETNPDAERLTRNTEDRRNARLARLNLTNAR